MTATVDTPTYTPLAKPYTQASAPTWVAELGVAAGALVGILHAFGVVDPVITLGAETAAGMIVGLATVAAGVHSHAITVAQGARDAAQMTTQALDTVAASPVMPVAVHSALTEAADLAHLAETMAPAPYDQGAPEPKAPSEPTGGAHSPFPEPLPGSADLASALAIDSTSPVPPVEATPATAPDPALIAAIVQAVAAQLRSTTLPPSE